MRPERGGFRRDTEAAWVQVEERSGGAQSEHCGADTCQYLTVCTFCLEAQVTILVRWCESSTFPAESVPGKWPSPTVFNKFHFYGNHFFFLWQIYGKVIILAQVVRVQLPLFSLTGSLLWFLKSTGTALPFEVVLVRVRL